MDTHPEVILGLHVDCYKEGFKAPSERFRASTD